MPQEQLTRRRRPKVPPRGSEISCSVTRIVGGWAGLHEEDAMRHLRWIVLAAVAVALWVAPVAGAHDSHKGRGGAVVAPAKDKWLGESWAQIYSLPLSENPFAGNGNPCLTLANKVIQEIGGPCTIEQGTTFFTGFGTAWSSAEDPFPQTRAEQLALAIASDRENVAGYTVTVDGGDPVDIRTPRFELF